MSSVLGVVKLDPLQCLQSILHRSLESTEVVTETVEAVESAIAEVVVIAHAWTAVMSHHSLAYVRMNSSGKENQEENKAGGNDINQ